MKRISQLLVLFFLFGCGSNEENSAGNDGLIPSDEKVKSTKKQSNAITQSMPSVMVFPSDALLKRLGYLKKVENQGVTDIVRDYQGAFIDSPNLKFVISAIQEEFVKAGFPLEDMEQQLKQLKNQQAMDEMTNVSRDLRSELLSTVRPDYIIEVDYQSKEDESSRDLNKVVQYSIKCLDVYTNKSIASVNEPSAGKNMSENDVASIIKTHFSSSLPDLKSQITSHFSDLLANGIEITVRVAIAQDSDVEMDTDCGDDEIGEKLNEWMKQNTVNQSFKINRNTSTEMSFTNVRIFTEDESGSKYTAYDFASDLRKSLKKGCGLDVSNKTQGLGDALVIINGLK